MSIKPPEVSLPKGGGAIHGIGETFKPDFFSGTGSYKIPFPITVARGLEPEVSIDYNSGSGNGPFGMGFSVGLEKISLKTVSGIPEYEGKDTYLLNGTELVPHVKKAREESGFTIQAYLPKVQKDFSRISHYIKNDRSESYWEVTTPENVTTIFGKTADARISNPKSTGQIFEWLAQETIDSWGNKIMCAYKSENNDNIPSAIENKGHSFNNKYIRSISYGNYFSLSGKELFAFEVIFDYGEYDLDNLNNGGKTPYLPTAEWAGRPDAFSSFTSGFEIRTCRLCKNILLFHSFENELGAPCLTKRLALDYENATLYDTQSTGLSTLKKITQIGYTRLGTLETDAYEMLSLPSLVLGFSQFKAPRLAVFRRLVMEGGPIPGKLDVDGFNPVDLNAEGISGLLYTKGNSVLYYEPKGGGEYAFPKAVNDFPLTHQFENGEVTLVDLEGNGELSLVYNAGNQSGYYKRTADDTWDGFKAFEHAPTSYGTDTLEQAGLSHNGMTDLVLAGPDIIQVYESKGTKGYEPPIKRLAPPDFPPIKKDYKKEFVGFANVFGDGLAHRIKVTNGHVSCWPDLGYGNFGEKIIMGNAPRFNDNDFDIDRVFFADIDGSGTTDIIYTYPDHVAIYINREGNSFSDPIIVPLPEAYSPIDQISFADILGNGTTCLVFTKTDSVPRHYYYDFIGETKIDGAWQDSIKPYLLYTIDNNLGATTQIQYCSSTKYYLDDKKEGRPWITKLPFPVQIVEKWIQVDKISGARFTQRFKYHDGYYDTTQGQFMGFGYVESWDTEEYEEFKQKTESPGISNLGRENYVAPVYVRTWHHTGVPFENGKITSFYKDQYFKGDAKAYDFPDSVFEAAIYLQGVETLKQAYSALKGKVIRTEVYADDESEHPELYKNPFIVSESNVKVSVYQEKKENDHAVFIVSPMESIEYHYERNPDDPRIIQQFTIATDTYGNVTQECSISLPRRANTNLMIYPEQQRLAVTLDWNRFVTPQLNFLYCHTSCETQKLELYGIDLQNADYFSYEQIKNQVALLGLPVRNQIVPYGQAPTSGIQAGQLIWTRSLFWDHLQSKALPLGEISALGLVHHYEQAAFTKEISIGTFDGRLIDIPDYAENGYLSNVIYTRGGYFFDEPSGYWWNKGLVQHYFDSNTPAAFHAVSKVENTFAVDTRATATPQDSSLCAATTIGYDAYYLRAIIVSMEIAPQMANITKAAIDYRTLLPKELTDINGNISQALFDPLGQVIVTSLSGTEKQVSIGGMTLYASNNAPADYKQTTVGTFEEVIGNPEKYLQGAGSYFYYNLNAWIDKGQPASAINLVRNHYWNSSTEDQAPYCQIGVSYNDGLGREVEKKLKVDSGLGYSAASTEKCVLKQMDDRWQVTGRTVYNNKGKVFAKYNPYFTDTPLYEDQKTICVPPATVTHYDAMEREIRIDTPKGFFSKVIFSSWEVARYDENDTIFDASYFQDNYPAKVSPEEKMALEQAIKCYNTPHTEVLDERGQICFRIQDNLGNVAENAFEDIVDGTGISSAEIWNALKNAGYLAVDRSHSPYGLSFITSKFQPYTRGFLLKLPVKFDAQISKITMLLKQACLTEFYSYDILGRIKYSIDPRLYYDVVVKDSNYHNFHYQYSMTDKDPMFIDSADAGTEKHLNNIFGQLLWSWSARDYCQLITYDNLQRKATLMVKKITEAGPVSNYDDFNLVEVFTYGESLPKAQENNLKGQLYELKDLSGIITSGQYSMLGEIQQTTRQFTDHYKEAANWHLNPVLQPDKHTTSYTYNAVKQLITETTPDNSVSAKTYDQAGKLNTISVNFADGTKQSIIDKITYDANGQRVQVSYGNGIRTSYKYEETTLRLLLIKSTKATSADTQDLTYTYDPIGNITNTIDRNIATVFHGNQKVDPVLTYTYDALYRLVKATGRQHIGINGNTYKNNSSQGSFMQSIFGPSPSGNDGNKLENYTETFTYDDSGNLILRKHKATSNTWTRDLAVKENCNHLKGMDYDASGNQRTLEINSSVDLSFNCCENLVKAAIITRPGEFDDSDYYVYDHQEQRTRKISERMANGSSVTLIEDKAYLGNYEIRRNYGGETKKPDGKIFERQALRVMDDKICVATIYYTEKDTQHPEKEKTRQCRFNMGNNLGSVSIEMDKDGNLISYEEYFPYGGTAIITGINEIEVSMKEYRYTGKERDGCTGLYYYGARYYVSWQCRWLKPDPAGTVDGLNLYGFVKGNPIKYVDSDGLSVSNKYEWVVDSSTSYVSPYLELNAVIDNFGKPTTSVVQTYEDLAARVGYDAGHGGKLQSTTVSDLHLMFEASVPLHYGFNSFLGDEWRNNMGTYSGSKRLVPLYSVMRTKTTAQFKSETSIPGFASLNDVLYEVSKRPAEVHHILYKAVRPQYANQTSNLMLVQRSAKESVEGPGQHELMHKVGSGNSSDKFRVLLTQFETEYISWYKAKQSVVTMQVSSIK